MKPQNWHLLCKYASRSNSFLADWGGPGFGGVLAPSLTSPSSFSSDCLSSISPLESIVSSPSFSSTYTNGLLLNTPTNVILKINWRHQTWCILKILPWRFSRHPVRCRILLSYHLTSRAAKKKIRGLKSKLIIWSDFKDVYKQLCITCTLISCSVVGDRSPFRPFWAASCSAANFSACNLSSSALAEAIRAASAASAAALRSACETRSPSDFTTVTSVGWKRTEYRGRLCIKTRNRFYVY